jgi:putative hydrolase of the HAD superfamily
MAIGFDADDTLWHNETIYSLTQEKFKKLLGPYHNEEWINERLFETEMRNLKFYGYGIKSFTLSMIETAIELSEGRISGEEIKSILSFGREMMTTPVSVFEQVHDVLSRLSASYKLLLVTKGDLIDQQSKIAQSNLESFFVGIEIVSNKRPATYQAILERYDINPDQFLMVGNSLRSDIIPVLEIGGHAVYIPYHITSALEEISAEEEEEHDYFQLEHFGQLPALLAMWREKGSG